MYLHARYYDPQLGIFLSPDPIGVLGGLNAYGYAFGDPVNLADRSGYGPDGVPGLPGWLPDWAIWKILEGLFGGGDAAGCPGGAANCRPRPTGPSNGNAVPRPEPCSIVTTPCDGIGGGVGGEPEAPPLVIGPVVIIGPGGGGGGGTGGGGRRGPAPQSSAQAVSQLMYDFITGTGPDKTWYGPDSPITQDLMRSPGIALARARYIRSLGRDAEGRVLWGAIPRIGDWQPPKPGSYGVLTGDDSPFATTNLTRHFLGSYTYRILKLSGETVEFRVNDSKSTYSLFFHLVPEIPRGQWPWPTMPVRPFSTTLQEYWWREHLHP